MGLSVGNSRLGHGGLGLLNALNNAPSDGSQVYNVTISATNADGTGSATLVLTVLPATASFLLTEAGDFLITEDSDFLIYG